MRTERFGMRHFVPDSLAGYRRNMQNANKTKMIHPIRTVLEGMSLATYKN